MATRFASTFPDCACSCEKMPSPLNPVDEPVKETYDVLRILGFNRYGLTRCLRRQGVRLRAYFGTKTLTTLASCPVGVFLRLHTPAHVLQVIYDSILILGTVVSSRFSPWRAFVLAENSRCTFRGKPKARRLYIAIVYHGKLNLHMLPQRVGIKRVE